MTECLLLGDSIAAGTYIFRHDCFLIGDSGINSKEFNKHHTITFKTDTAIISLGSNDHEGIDTRKELEHLRKNITAKRVYWIMPAIKPDIQQIVEEVANKHQDWIVNIPELTKDGIHPTMKGYKKIANITK